MGTKILNITKFTIEYLSNDKFIIEAKLARLYFKISIASTE